jgi:hypothetical protein
MRKAVAVSMSLCAIACSDPLVFDDWTVPVPSGTRVVEYAHVPHDERTERLEIVEDLVIGGDPDDPNQTFYRVEDLAVDATGNVYVLERGNKSVRVFDQRGRYLRTFGSEGQGPGELQDPHGIIVAGDAVVVPDMGNGRVNRWSLDGEYIGTSTMVPRTFTGLGLADGTILGGFIVFRQEAESWREGVYGRFSAEGVELQRFATLRLAHREIVMVPSTPARMAAGRQGDLYVTRADRYQVLAFDADGSYRWALRTTWPTPLIPEEIIERQIERVRERQPDYEPQRDTWPERMPAIGNMAVDGRGNLYVFPYVHLPRDPSTGEALQDPPDEFAVDVWSPDGQPLWSGWIPLGGWTDAHEKYVYAIGTDPDSGEEVVMRYRLVTPF